MKISICLSILAVAATTAFAGATAPKITGDYLEVRSCDVFTGYCFANSEMNLAGKEGMMVWSVREGTWKGTRLDGLRVIAVVASDGTLGDVEFEGRSLRAVLITDAKADAKQKEALTDFARSMAGKLIGKVVDVKSLPIEADFATCAAKGCASVKAGNLAEIKTSCLSSHHGVCVNEETYYPPMSKIDDAYPVFTEVANFKGTQLDSTWQVVDKRSSFLGSFAVPSAIVVKNEIASR